MPSRWSWYDRMSRSGSSLQKLLGDLQIEIMEEMWKRDTATVRDIATTIQKKRPVAYTTVMTVMAHLSEKGLLAHTSLDKKTYLYHVALSREAFLARESRKMVDSMVTDFGDLALTQFLEAIEQADPRHIEQLRKIWEESGRQADNQEAED